MIYCDQPSKHWFSANIFTRSGPLFWEPHHGYTTEGQAEPPGGSSKPGSFRWVFDSLQTAVYQSGNRDPAISLETQSPFQIAGVGKGCHHTHANHAMCWSFDRSGDTIRSFRVLGGATLAYQERCTQTALRHRRQECCLSAALPHHREYGLGVAFLAGVKNAVRVQRS